MALRDAGCPVVGVAFIGDPEPAVEQTIIQMSGVPHLGRLGRIENLTPDTLRHAFEAIDKETIRGAL